MLQYVRFLLFKFLFYVLDNLRQKVIVSRLERDSIIKEMHGGVGGGHFGEGVTQK